MRKVFCLIAFLVSVGIVTAQVALPTSSGSNTLVNGATSNNSSISSSFTNGFKLSVNGSIILYGTNVNTATSPTLYFRNTTASTGRIWGFNSDNTGIFTIADATGTTSPLSHVTRLTINSLGNMGLGTISNPTTFTSLLNLGNTAANSKLAVWDNGTIKSGFGWATGQLRFHLSAATDKFSFLSSEGASSDLMTILGSGKVGIGTSSPNSNVNLDVFNNARVSNQFYVDRSGGSLTNYLGIIARGPAEASNLGNPLGNGALEIMAAGTSGIAFGTNNAADIAFATNGAEKMRLTSTGKLGLGTNAPNALVTLDVAGNSRFSNSLWIDRADRTLSGYLGIIARGPAESSNLGNPFGNGALEMMASGTSGIAFGTSNAAGISFATNSSERIRITSDGKIGFGVSSPHNLTTFDFAGNTRFSNTLWVDRPGSGLTSYLALNTRGATEASNFGNPIGNGATEISTYGSAGIIFGTSDAKPLVFGIGGLERARFSSTGNLGIGTTNPTATLEVAGLFKTGGVSYPIADGSPGQVLTTNGAGVASWSSVSAGSGSSQWTTSGTDIFNANTGNVAIGTSTINPAYKLEVAGGVHSNYGFYANGTSNPGFFMNATNEAFFHYGPNTTRLTGGYSEYIEFGGVYGNRITLHSLETYLEAPTFHMGGLRTNVITPVSFLASYGSTASNPDIGVKVNSNYVNNGAGGPNFAATLAIGDANINTAAGVTNDISALLLNPTVNTSGGTTKVRGLLYNPTLTSTAGVTNVAIETVTGNTILGSTSGNTLVGTNTTNGSKLQVLGSTHVTIPANSDLFTIKSTGAQSWRKFADFNVTDADGTSNSYGLNFTAYNADAGNRIIKVNQYNATEVKFDGGIYKFANPTEFDQGIKNINHQDFNITLSSNTINPTTGIKFLAEDFGGGPIMSIMQNGRVGIGTTDPQTKFHTVGSVRLEGLSANNALTNVLVTDAVGNLSYRDASTLGGTGGSSVWATSGTNIVNANSGVVIVGNAPVALPNDTSLRLAVNGTAYAKKLKITQTGWADYVFDSSYRLRPLAEVEAFVKANAHLPEVASAKEVAANGVDLGENQVLLLKKIEELTLYSIEQNKKQEAQQQTIEQQNKLLLQLQQEVQELKKSKSKKNKD